MVIRRPRLILALGVVAISVSSSLVAEAYQGGASPRAIGPGGTACTASGITVKTAVDWWPPTIKNADGTLTRSLRAAVTFNCGSGNSAACAICVMGELDSGPNNGRPFNWTTVPPPKYMTGNFAPNCGSSWVQNVTAAAQNMKLNTWYRATFFMQPYSPGVPCAQANYSGGTYTRTSFLTPAS